MKKSRLGARVAALAAERGIASGHIAEALGIQRARLDTWLADPRPADMHLQAAAHLVDVPVAELLDLAPPELREAAAGSHEATRRAIERALGAMGVDGHPVAVFDTSVVIGTWHSDAFTRYDYTMGADGTVTLTNPAPVVETFAAAATSGDITEAVAGLAPDASGEPGRLWRVRAIEAGTSANGIDYPPAVLREAVGLFEGARVYCRSDDEHVDGTRPDFRDLEGVIEAPEWIAEANAIDARLRLLHPAGRVGTMIREAHAAGMLDLVGGMSIVGRANLRAVTIDGRMVRRADALTAIESVDIVANPSAGGRIMHVIEARRARRQEDSDMKFRDQMRSTVRRALGASRLDGLAADDDAGLDALYREAIVAEARAGAPAPTGISAADVDARIGAALDLAGRRSAAVAEIAASGLPAPAMARLQARFAGAASIADGAVAEAIRDEREYLSAVVPDGQVTGLGASSVRESVGRPEQIRAMVDALFDRDDRSVQSIKEVYIELTGDRRVTGQLAHCDRARIAEAIQIGTGTGAGVFAQVFGDSIARRMQMAYRETGIYDWWREIVESTRASDFRTQHRVRWGGYGDLPTVAQGGAYTALTSPTDSEETYAVAKYGGLESVTLEAIKNDDLSQVQRIPTKLARAAKRTLSAHLAGIFTANSGAGETMGDTHTLFHSAHNNRGTAALAAASLAAGRLAMIKQTEDSSAKQIGIPPRFLLVPWALEETGKNLFARNTNNDPTFVQTLALPVIPVPEWTDANDWVLAADRADVTGIEVGFLDGMEEPEIFVQSAETVGSLFDKDEWTYKIRHIYGWSAIDYRAFYKGVVA